MCSTWMGGSSRFEYTSQILALCAGSITNTRSAQCRSCSEIFRSLFGLSPAERMLKRGSFLKICCAFYFAHKRRVYLVGRSWLLVYYGTVKFHFMQEHYLCPTDALIASATTLPILPDLLCSTSEDVCGCPAAGILYFLWSLEKHVCFPSDLIHWSYRIYRVRSWLKNRFLFLVTTNPRQARYIGG